MTIRSLKSAGVFSKSSGFWQNLFAEIFIPQPGQQPDDFTNSLNSQEDFQSDLSAHTTSPAEVLRQIQPTYYLERRSFL